MVPNENAGGGGTSMKFRNHLCFALTLLVVASGVVDRFAESHMS